MNDELLGLPWRSYRAHNGDTNLVSDSLPGFNVIATVYTRFERSQTVPPVPREVADLMLAAPDLLAALKRIVDGGFSAQAEEQARAAIAKAG